MSLDLGLITFDVVAIVDQVGATADVVRSHSSKRRDQPAHRNVKNESNLKPQHEMR